MKPVAVFIIRGVLVVAFYVRITSSLQYSLNSVNFRLRKIVEFCTRCIRSDLSVYMDNNGIRGVFVVPVSLFKLELGSPQSCYCLAKEGSTVSSAKSTSIPVRHFTSRSFTRYCQKEAKLFSALSMFHSKHLLRIEQYFILKVSLLITWPVVSRRI